MVLIKSWGKSPHVIGANMLHCDIVVSEFELKSGYYIHFHTNTLGKGMNPTYTCNMGNIIPLSFFYKNYLGIE